MRYTHQRFTLAFWPKVAQRRFWKVHSRLSCPAAPHARRRPGRSASRRLLPDTSFLAWQTRFCRIQVAGMAFSSARRSPVCCFSWVTRNEEESKTTSRWRLPVAIEDVFVLMGYFLDSLFFLLSCPFFMFYCDISIVVSVCDIISIRYFDCSIRITVWKGSAWFLLYEGGFASASSCARKCARLNRF